MQIQIEQQWTFVIKPKKKNCSNSFNLSWASTLLTSSNQRSLVIRQIGGSQNEGNKKTKHAKFSENRTFLTP